MALDSTVIHQIGAINQMMERPFSGTLRANTKTSSILQEARIITLQSDEDNLLPKCDPSIFGPRCIELVCGAVDLYRLAISALLRVFCVPSQCVALECSIVLQNVLIRISPTATLITFGEGKRIFLEGSCEDSGGNDAFISKRLRIPQHISETGPKQPNQLR